MFKSYLKKSCRAFEPVIYSDDNYSKVIKNP